MKTYAYNSANELLMRGDLHLDTDPLQVLLLADTYQPDIGAHVKIADLEAHEIASPGYFRQQLESVRIERDASGMETALFADDLAWPDSTIVARYYVVARRDDLIACVDCGVNKYSSDGTLRLEWQPGGVLRLGRP